MAGFPSVLLVLLLALAGCVSVLSQRPFGQFGQSGLGRFWPQRCGQVCRRPCPFGSLLDFRGCPTCTCRFGGGRLRQCPQRCRLCRGGFGRRFGRCRGCPRTCRRFRPFRQFRPFRPFPPFGLFGPFRGPFGDK